MRLLANVTCVSIGGRGLIIEGPPGSGKSSLALALIDRGADLVGDDGVALERRGAVLVAHPPPNIAGKLEIRGVGIVELPTVSVPLALTLTLGKEPARLPEVRQSEREGILLPQLHFAGDALRAEWAMRCHGLQM